MKFLKQAFGEFYKEKKNICNDHELKILFIIRHFQMGLHLWARNSPRKPNN